MRRTTQIKQKKHLSQVFLKEDWPCVKIAEILKKNKIKRVLEIGPGLGILTKELVKAGFDVAVVEKDSRYADRLEELKGNLIDNQSKEISVINKDILDFDLKSWLASSDQTTAVCGNIPYKISSPILRWALKDIQSIQIAVFLVQLEFGLRVAGSANHKSYGSLSIYTQLRANTKFEFQVPRNVFKPVPKVDSAVISLSNRKLAYNSEVLEFVEKLTRQSFTQRRKKLSNSLEPILKKFDKKIDLNIDLNRRCDSLTPEEFVELAEQLLKYQS